MADCQADSRSVAGAAFCCPAAPAAAPFTTVPQKDWKRHFASLRAHFAAPTMAPGATLTRPLATHFLFRAQDVSGGIPGTVLHSCRSSKWYKKYSVNRQYFIDLRENVADIFVKLESRGFVEKLLLKNAGQQQFPY
jgi:hypothetical protein